MTTQSRAAQFLSKLAEQEFPVQVDAYSAPRKSSRMGAKFLSALKVGLPALMLTASVHAQTATPEVQMSIDAQPPVTLQSLQDAAQTILAQLKVNATPQAKKDADLEQIVTCFQEKVIDEGLSRTEKGFAAVFLRASAPGILDEMSAWAVQTGKDRDLALAAYCVNPLNWKAQLGQWEKKAQRAEQLARSGSAASDTIVQYHAHEGLERYAAQRATQLHAMQNAAHYQSTGQFDRSLMHKVDSREWISAVTSIIGGVAQATGSRDNERAARDLNRTARNGERISRRISSLDRYDGARKWEQIGKVVGEVGRTVDLGEALKFLRPRN